MNYLKVSRASHLTGKNYQLYRSLEMLPGLLSLLTFAFLIILSYAKPIYAAYIIIIFDVYWLLLVAYLSIHLVAAYKKMKHHVSINWQDQCETLTTDKQITPIKWNKMIHLVILPTYKESKGLIRESIDAIKNDGFPLKNIIIVLAVEARAGELALKNAKEIENNFNGQFRDFLITIHPDNLAGEIKGKGSNQAWAAKEVRKLIIDKQNIKYENILVSVFDIDTIVIRGYFHCLTYKFLTVPNPYRASYQPIPVYNNNIWSAPFFARIAASSNSFWQMMQQIRQEKLATYSSHSMTWRTLIDIDFWSTNMVSEDSRIFWHALLHYNGDYRVEPLYYPVSMDACMDKNIWATMKNLYKQQRRWGFGVENVPYIIFNTIKRWDTIDHTKMIKHILVQLHGFHSWATNALIISIIGWMPIILGGQSFNELVLSGNLPFITEGLMRFAMIGLLLSAILSTLLLPNHPSKFSIFKKTIMFLEWLILPASIIIFGSIPALDAQVRLMLGKYLGFWVTPKER